MGLTCQLKDCEDFDKQDLAKGVLSIWIMATHGEGEPTDNAQRVHLQVKRAAREGEHLMDGDYVVFGLGDSDYEHFNAMGKFFQKNLKAIGGKSVFEYGENDAQDPDMEQAFMNWKKNLWASVFEHYMALGGTPVEKSKDEGSKKRGGPKLEVVEMREGTKLSFPEKIKYDIITTNHLKAKDVPIKSIRELKQTNEYGSTLEVIFDLEGTGVSYVTAQNMGVFPPNSEKDVD